MGDFNTISSNPFAAATTPFIQPNLLKQDFVEDPQGTSDLVNFTPNYVPIALGADVVSVGLRPTGQESYSPPPVEMIGAPLY